MNRREFIMTLQSPALHSVLQSEDKTEIFRLLSFSTTPKFILVSRPHKEKLLLAADKARLRVMGKPAEWKDLSSYVRVQVTFNLTPFTVSGDVIIDGTASEIEVVEYLHKFLKMGG